MSIFRGIERISLPDEEPAPEFVLMKSFEMLECDPVREERMTAALRSVYRLYKQALEEELHGREDLHHFGLMLRLYELMQHFDDKSYCDRDKEREARLLKVLRERSGSEHLVFNDTTGYWNVMWYQLQDVERPSYSRLMKMYLGVRDRHDVSGIFYEAIERLMMLDEFFCAKMSRYERVDPLCIWCSRRGYEEIRELAFAHAEKLHDSGLPFVPFLDHVGLNREFQHSYNEAIANLLCLYFMGDVKDKADISSEGFVRRAVSAYFTDFQAPEYHRERYKRSKEELERFGFGNAEALDAYPKVINGLLNAHRNLHRFEYLTLIDCFNVLLGGWNDEETALLRPGNETSWLWSHTEDRENCWE